MINDFLNLKKLDILNKFEIVFGIFQEDGTKVVEVNVLNTDDSTSTTSMSIADIMYFTNNGTLTIPGRHIYDRCMPYIIDRLDILLDSLLDEILIGNIDEDGVYSRLQEFAFTVENYVKSVFISTIHNVNNLGTLLNQKDENKYLYDLRKLKNYVKCKVIKK